MPGQNHPTEDVVFEDSAPDHRPADDTDATNDSMSNNVIPLESKRQAQATGPVTTKPEMDYNEEIEKTRRAADRAMADLKRMLEILEDCKKNHISLLHIPLTKGLWR